MFRRSVAKFIEHPWMIMISEEHGVPKMAVIVGTCRVPHCLHIGKLPRILSPLLAANPDDIKLKYHIELAAALVGEQRHLVVSDPGGFSYRHHVIVRQHLAVHLLDVVMSMGTRTIDRIEVFDLVL